MMMATTTSSDHEDRMTTTTSKAAALAADAANGRGNNHKMNNHNNNNNILTRSKAFRALVDKAYAICDSDKTGEVSKTELYAGLLLVHLNLAKYAGPAACYPPTRQVCNQLFDAADANHSGGIDKDEFVKIMGITCAQILSRILVYYLILILLVPFLAAMAVDQLQIPNGSYKEMAAEQTIALGLFFFIIPFVWNHIDAYSEHQLLVKGKGKEGGGKGPPSSISSKDE